MQQHALDLRRPKFRRVLSGIDPLEVDAFLETAAESYEAVYTELETLREQLAVVNSELSRIREAERGLSRVVVAAEEEASRKREAAGRQVEALIQQAEQKAARLLAPAEEAREKALIEIASLAARHGRAVEALETVIAELKRPLLIEELESTAPKKDAPLHPEEDAATAPEAVAGHAEAASDHAALGVPVLSSATVSASAAPIAAPAAETMEAARPIVEMPAAVNEDAAAVEASEVSERGGAEPESDAPPAGVLPATPALMKLLAELSAAEPPSDERANGVAGAIAGSEAPDAVASLAAAVAGSAFGVDGSSRSDDFDEDAAAPGKTLAASWPIWWWVSGGAAVAGALLIALAVGMPGYSQISSSNGGDTTIAGERVKIPVSAAGVVPASVQSQASPAAADSSPAAAAPAAKEAGVRLKLIAVRECWVRVTVDGRAEELTIPAGQSITRRGSEHVLLRVGDAGALQVELNGEPLPPLGADGQVVNRRFVNGA